MGETPVDRMQGEAAAASLHGSAQPSANEAGFRSLFEQAGAGIARVSPGGQLLEVNRRFCEIVGYTHDELLRLSFQQITHPEDLNADLELFQDLLAGTIPIYTLEKRYCRNDGSSVWVNLTVSLLRSDQGQPLCAVFVIEDIQERKRIEAELRANEEQFRTLADALPALAWMANADGWITWYNSRWYEYTGTTPQEMDGWGWEKVHDPAALPVVLERWNASIRTGEAFEMIFPLRGADGVLRSFLTRSVPVLDSSGQVRRWIGTNAEIDELERTRTALTAERKAYLDKNQEAERQWAELETIYRTAPIGLALFSVPEYRYLRLNDRQAAFFGLRPEQIIGRTLTEMAPIEGLQELFDQVSRGEPVANYPLEGALVTDPEDYRYWTVSYFPVYGADGKVRAITAASLEITQQKKAEQALGQSEKLAVVGRLASSIAHEINNPLEAVTNLLYLASHSDDPQEAREHVALAEVELRRVAAITSQTLRFHKQASSPQAITAAQLIESVLSIFQGRIANSGVRVTQRLRGGVPVRCFEGEIRQVISNLVSNALEAMETRGGCILMRSRNATHWRTGERGVVITVADNGSGMSPATLGRLYNAFFTTKGLTGTGLGLWVSKDILDRHRGVLRVRSSQSAAHHGTVFTIFLPFEPAIR